MCEGTWELFCLWPVLLEILPLVSATLYGLLPSLNCHPFSPFLFYLRDLVLRPLLFSLYIYLLWELINYHNFSCLCPSEQGQQWKQRSGGVRIEVSLTKRDLQTLQNEAENKPRPGRQFVLKRSNECPRWGRPAGQSRGKGCLTLELCYSRRRPAVLTTLGNLLEVQNLKLYPLLCELEPTGDW